MIADAPPTPVGVAEREFRIAVYRPTVRPGRIRLNISNLGEDAHNLVVRSPRGRTLKRSPEIRPGERYALRVTVPTPGRYTLVCTTADHEARGMRTRLRVSRH
jgi:plastocyanin